MEEKPTGNPCWGSCCEEELLATVPPWFIQYAYKYPQNKADILLFSVKPNCSACRIDHLQT